MPLAPVKSALVKIIGGVEARNNFAASTESADRSTLLL